MESFGSSPVKYYTYDPEIGVYRVQLMSCVVEIESLSSELNLSDKSLSDDDIKRILQIYDNNSVRERLKKIFLSNTGLTYNGCCLFVEALRLGFKNLELIDLSHNNIGDKGFEAIVTVLRRQNPIPCPSLRHLNISNNNITTAGAVLIHKLIRRSDGILNITFNDNPITGEGLGFIISAKYWETFSIIRTNADESFTHFLTALSKYNFNLRYLTIIQNHLSQSSLRLLFPSLTRIQIPTLQSLTLEENIAESGFLQLMDISRSRAMSSLKRLLLQNCNLSLSAAFSLVQRIHAGGFPRLLEIRVIQNGMFSLTGCYESITNQHVCSSLELDCEGNLEKKEFHPFFPPFLRCLRWKNKAKLPLNFVFCELFKQSKFTNLSEFHISGVHDTPSSLQEMLISLPATTRSVVIDNVCFLEEEETLCHMEKNVDVVFLLDPLKITKTNNGSALIRSISSVIHRVSTLDLRENKFSSEDIQSLCDFVQRESILFNSLLIDEEHLSEEEKNLIASTMITEIKEPAESPTDRCNICSVM